MVARGALCRRSSKSYDGQRLDNGVLLEASARHGVLLVPLSKYAHFNTRICRPVGLSSDECQKVIDYALARVGMQYDTRQIFDLARYLFPYPPVPVFLRRRLLAIGSGDPTKAICSTLIAESFASYSLSDFAGKRGRRFLWRSSLC